MKKFEVQLEVIIHETVMVEAEHQDDALDAATDRLCEKYPTASVEPVDVKEKE